MSTEEAKTSEQAPEAADGGGEERLVDLASARDGVCYPFACSKGHIGWWVVVCYGLFGVVLWGCGVIYGEICLE